LLKYWRNISKSSSNFYCSSTGGAFPKVHPNFAVPVLEYLPTVHPISTAPERIVLLDFIHRLVSQEQTKLRKLKI
jgi:hypothetical protein